MDTSRSRNAAQNELLRAVRQIFPEPLIELRVLAANDLPDAKALEKCAAKGHLQALADLRSRHRWVLTEADRRDIAQGDREAACHAARR